MREYNSAASGGWENWLVTGEHRRISVFVIALKSDKFSLKFFLVDREFQLLGYRTTGREFQLLGYRTTGSLLYCVIALI
jgi:hypothetical protein